MASDGRGGLWVSHNRGQLDTYYQLAHVASDGKIDWYVDNTSTHGFTGSAVRASLAYDAERHILAQGRNSTVEVFQVAYDATTGVPTLTKIATTPQVNKLTSTHLHLTTQATSTYVTQVQRSSINILFLQQTISAPFLLLNHKQLSKKLDIPLLLTL